MNQGVSASGNANRCFCGAVATTLSGSGELRSRVGGMAPSATANGPTANTTR